MSKNVAVFVDVANIFYAAKAAGVDIDYVTLLKASSAGRDLVRAYAYTGLDPDNENQRNFHDFLRRHGYKVVSKDIRKYGDGKVKANLDIELVVDMMKTARNLDIAIVVSGDGDFAPAIRAVQEQGVRVEVVSFRGNTSSDLMDVADQFTDITQIAKVEKGSSRSGRRVAGDDADLSMTEVPDKQSEGAGDRARGRGRTRRSTAATTATASRSRGRSVAALGRDSGMARDGSEAREGRETREPGEPNLVVLPGEKLSRAAASRATAGVEPIDTLEVGELDDIDAEAGEADGGANDAGTEDGRRRRRRRGGRGRGRGRGREGTLDEAAAGNGAPEGGDDDGEDDDELGEAAPSPARRAASSFGSVWDSQIGIQAASRRGPVVDDEEDLEEPAIPEYLLTERRQRDSGRGRGGAGGRGRGGAYAAALDRERFGGGRGSIPSRFAEQPRREGGFGRPDRDRGGPVRDRGDRGNRGFREDRSFRDARPARGSGDEPWSEVPPEVEAMLRAQMGSRASGDARRGDARRPSSPETMAPAAAPEPAAQEPEGSAAPAARSRGRTRSAASRAEAPTAEPTAGEPAAEAAGGSRTTRSRTRKVTSTEVAAGEAAPDATAAATPAKARTTRTSKTAASTPTRSTTRRTRTAASDGGDAAAIEAAGPETGSAEAATTESAPKRRTTRRKAEPTA